MKNQDMTGPGAEEPGIIRGGMSGGGTGEGMGGGWDHYVDSRPYPDPAAMDGPAPRFDPGASTGRLMLRRFLRHRLAVLGALFLGLSYLSLPFVDFLVPYGANERDVEHLYAPPQGIHLFHDGRFIGPTGAEVVELGPLNATIHQINERVAVADLERLSRIYSRMLEKLLAS